MAYKLIFKRSAINDLDKLDLVITKRIIHKLKWLAEQPDVYADAVKLTDAKIGRYRLRIADYRVIFDCRKQDIFPLRIGHRKDIYQ